MKLAPLFSHHAVLQRDLPIPVWGSAEAGASVAVSLAGHSVRVPADSQGRWMARLPAMQAGGPHELKVESASEQVIVRDLLIGDVWICSGQSNMEWKLNLTYPNQQQAELSELPNLRLLTVTTPAQLGQNRESLNGQWTLATPETLLNFSAVGGWFGRRLHRELGVPIGLICNAWGGTRIQAWMSRDALVQDPDGREEIARYDRELRQPSGEGKATYANFRDWESRGAPQDTGNAGLEKGWHLTEFKDDTWGLMTLPCNCQSAGHPGNGIFWFRRSFTPPAEWAGKDLELHLGRIDKHDDTWVNGERVGGLSWEAGPDSWSTLRVYPISAQASQEGRLTIAVRARSHIYDGGMIGPSGEMYLRPVGGDPDDAVSLDGPWRYSIEEDWGVVAPPEFTWGTGNPNTPHILFDNRVMPLLPYGIRGVIWYQGESNAGQAKVYRRLLPAMIRDWRRAWEQGDFPFYQVQLANYRSVARDPGPSEWAELRESQVSALAEPHVGMAVAIDVGDALDIHPRNKRSVGERLACWALAETYGRGGLPSGPLYERFTIEAGGKIRLHFQYASDLRTSDGKSLRYVALAGDGKRFLWAQSRIEGETLVVWHPDVPEPAAVRYAWADNPEGCNLENGAGLPASPFRTDTW